MNNQPDRNDDFDYPPLTAKDFEEIMHFYKYDDTVMEVSGRKVHISITIPIVFEQAFKVFGHRIGIEITDAEQDNGKNLRTMPAIEGHTAETAAHAIKKAALTFVRQAA
jgi:hypothetical protein